MLTDFIKTEKRRRRYLDTPFGPYLDGYLADLSTHKFELSTAYMHLKDIGAFGDYLLSQGINSLDAVDEDLLDRFVAWYVSTPHRCGPPRQSGKFAAQMLYGSLRRMFVYLRLTGAMHPRHVHKETIPYDDVLREYLAFLEEHRGLVSSTIDQHHHWARAFLSRLGEREPRVSLSELTTQEVEDVADLVSVGSSVRDHQRSMAAIDALIAYLQSAGHVSEACTPFLPRRKRYALATLPSTIPWKDIEQAIRGIDRSTAMGRRDHALVQLVAIYGLRAGEVVGLRLDDFDWRRNVLRVRQTKTRRLLWLPLIPTVVDTVVDYLRHGRPQTKSRHVFLKCQAPIHPITRAILYGVVRKTLRRAGIKAGQYGPHILRHARATSLLRKGHSLKVIGDLLGHRVPEATALYCKLAVDDLRGVALELPEVSS